MSLLNTLRDTLEPARRAGLIRCLYRLRRILNQRLFSPRWLGPRLRMRPIETRPGPLPSALISALETLQAARKGAAKTDTWDPEAQRVHLLNQEGFPVLERPGGENPPIDDGLWQVRLHGFDWLWSKCDDRTLQRAISLLISTWTASNPIGQGAGWDAYTTSRRLVAFCVVGRMQEIEGLYETIARTQSFLQERLERDLDNNHLFTNLKALVFCDLLYPELRAKARQERDRSEFFEVLTRHLYPDGGHFEASCSYHLASWHDALEIGLLLRARQQELPQSFVSDLIRMERYAVALQNPLGHMPLLGDSVANEPLSVAALQDLARALALPRPERDAASQVFRETGYAVLRRGSAPTWVLFDSGKLGPDHCPGHGHADMLSIEVWRGRQPVLVDSGTYQYARGVKRDSYRGTASHNTATVNDQDQVRFVGPFRIADLAGAHFTSIELGPNYDRVEGEHSGYQRLACRVTHRRTVTLDAAGVLTLEDRFSGQGSYRVSLAFHIAPTCTVQLEADRARIGLGDGSSLVLEVSGGGEWRLDAGWLSQTWYREQAIPVVRYQVLVQGTAFLTTRLA